MFEFGIMTKLNIRITAHNERECSKALLDSRALKSIVRTNGALEVMKVP